MHTIRATNNSKMNNLNTNMIFESALNARNYTTRNDLNIMENFYEWHNVGMRNKSSSGNGFKKSPSSTNTATVNQQQLQKSKTIECNSQLSKSRNSVNLRVKNSVVSPVQPSKSQLFTKNPNLYNINNNNNKMKRIVRTSTTSTATNSAQNNIATSSSSSLTPKGVIITKRTVTTGVGRAKSTEPPVTGPITSRKISSQSVATSKSAVALDLQAPAVRHPATQQINRMSSKFFGPKLEQKEVSNVKLIENNNYNYGVPSQQQQQQQQKKSKFSLNKKPNYGANKTLNEGSNGQVANSTVITTDIFVYARKRPMLTCEANFTDVVILDKNSECLEDDNEAHTNSICINEFKNAVDGTPILRKVYFF